MHRLLTVLVAVAVVGACASGGRSGSSPGNDGGAGGSGGGSPGDGDGAGSLLPVDGSFGSSDGSPIGSLSITPSNPVIDVSVVNGSLASVTIDDSGAASIVFQAAAIGGRVVPANWSIDRGELGTLDLSSGTFTPNGDYAGIGTVTAIVGNTTATTTVTVRLHMLQNGGAAALDGGTAEAGAGGYGGVGGEGPGAPVDDATLGRLRGAATAPASEAEFGVLYPYDMTVWPRGLLPPLVQWQTTHTATAVRISLTQKNFEFEGVYSGAALIHQPIDPTAWRAALNGNGGDPLRLEVRIADAANVYGPRSQSWVVAAGLLKGTLYYDSYGTRLANPVPGANAGTNGTISSGAILAIKEGMSDPVLALPGTQNQCVTCHIVSDDGSTLFAPNTNTSRSTYDYSNSASYDLKNNGAIIANYNADLPGSSGNAPDGTSNNMKFMWAGLWKDGTFALQSKGHVEDGSNATSPPSLESGIFRRDSANQEKASGFDGVITEAVTPAFSRNGSDTTKVAFNYWTGTLSPGGGGGHTLDVMDFTCGPVATPVLGAPSCGTYAFSNLRRLYTNADTANGYVGWPAWLPDSSGIVFHNTVKVGPDGRNHSPISTWYGSKAQLWFTDVPGDPTVAPQPVALGALNGDGANGTSVLPKAAGIANHDDDDQMNYEPTVNPIASGGYAWVVFTSRRMYGNVAQGDPYASPDGKTPVAKKLWVAALDLHPVPGKDPSHPAFYLPAQELLAGNMRGFWVVDPCRPDGASCDTGDECCGGYCRPDASGTLTCGNIKTGCAKEFERCVTTSDCCGAAQGYECVNGFCSLSIAK
jgi:hypothetical protein